MANRDELLEALRVELECGIITQSEYDSSVFELTIERVLNEDIQRIDPAFHSGAATLTVSIRANGLPETQIDMHPEDDVMDKVQEALALEEIEVESVRLGRRDVSRGTVEENEIQVRISLVSITAVTARAHS